MLYMKRMKILAEHGWKTAIRGLLVMYHPMPTASILLWSKFPTLCLRNLGILMIVLVLIGHASQVVRLRSGSISTKCVKRSICESTWRSTQKSSVATGTKMLVNGPSSCVRQVLARTPESLRRPVICSYTPPEFSIISNGLILKVWANLKEK